MVLTTDLQLRLIRKERTNLTTHKFQLKNIHYKHSEKTGKNQENIITDDASVFAGLLAIYVCLPSTSGKYITR
jgi:hypothetical protein